jgi:hypothetical protein
MDLKLGGDGKEMDGRSMMDATMDPNAAERGRTREAT